MSTRTSLLSALALIMLTLFSTTIGHPVSTTSNEVQRISFQLSEKARTCNIPRVLLDKKVVVIPHPSCNFFKVLRCYCLSLDEYPGPSTVHITIGKCLYGCFYVHASKIYHNVNLSSESDICSILNRKGVLCGQCMEGYGVPAYSFSLKCVHCENESLWTTIPRYVLVAYGPLTLFLAMTLVFTVSVNSAPLHGWILVCQIMTTGVVMYPMVLEGELMPHSGISPYIHVLGSLYGVWNLDFFRSVYKPFCLHPNLTTLQVMSLDYFIALYPLLLIVLMYAMVELYSCNLWPMVHLGRLLHHCCVRFRNHLNIRTSLIDAFGTFFSLSFVKFLSTSTNLLASTPVWINNNSTCSWNVYFDGSQQPFRGSHILYAVIATLVTVIFNIIPLIIILLYSFPRGQVLLNILPRSFQTAMYPFVDNALACYKDGTNGTRNCRYFAVVYYFALIASLICSVFARNTIVLGWNAYVCILAGMLVAVIQPYKSKLYNTVDTVLILAVGLGYAGALSHVISFSEAPFETSKTRVLFTAPLFAPLLYITGYVSFKCCFRFWKLFSNRLRTSCQLTAPETIEKQSLLFNFPPE